MTSPDQMSIHGDIGHALRGLILALDLRLDGLGLDVEQRRRLSDITDEMGALADRLDRSAQAR